MATNTAAFFVFPQIGGKEGGTGFSPGVASGLYPESQPSCIWGQGTPDGDRSPFVNLNKGSLYLAVNNTDDASCVYCKVDEGGDDDDWARLLQDKMGYAHGAASGSDCSIDWDITMTAAASVYYAGVDVLLTVSGTTGAVWASTMFLKVTQGTDKSVNGYLSVLELELDNSCATSSALFPLVINMDDDASSNAQRAFMAFREYGDSATPALFWLGEEFVTNVGTDSNTVIWTTESNGGYESAVDYALRFIVGNANTPYWIPVCSTGPGT